MRWIEEEATLMSQRQSGNLTLPKSIYGELGISGQDFRNGRKKAAGRTIRSRKDFRRAEKIEKKKRPSRIGGRARSSWQDVPAKPDVRGQHSPEGREETSSLKLLTTSKPASLSSTRRKGEYDVQDQEPIVTHRVRKQLAQDDADISNLEKALGLAGKKAYPKTFEDEGLNTLLVGLDDMNPSKIESLGKRKRGQDVVSHNSIRSNMNDIPQRDTASSEEISDFDGFESEQSYTSPEENETTPELDHTVGFGGSDGENARKMTSLASSTVRHVGRENPYKPPGAFPSEQLEAKYIPPSLRGGACDTSEDLSRLRRQLKGLLNRLSDSNLLSTIEEVENLIRSYARQDFFSMLIGLLLGILSDPAVLQRTFIITNAGLIAALSKVFGSDFAAEVIWRLDAEFQTQHKMLQDQQSSSNSGKGALNLISGLAQLYIFRILSSQLIYDYMSLCLQDLCECNIELLLQVIRIGSHQLKHDDPSAWKNVEMSLHDSRATIGNDKLSTRSRHILDEIDSLISHKPKRGVTAALTISEHTTRMKRTLGSLNQRNLQMIEPLEVSLDSIRKREKKGKWWLEGTKYQKRDSIPNDTPISMGSPARLDASDEGLPINQTTDLVSFAKLNGMNTDIRRAIFITIMSSTDYDDAGTRLKRLRLRRNQEHEIPQVLFHCTASEATYNPFYTSLSVRLCSDRRLRKVFQFSLPNVFKQLGECLNDEIEDNDDQRKDTLELRSVFNMARMYGNMIAKGAQTLGCSTKLRLAYLQQSTRIFVEVLLVTIILQTQKGANQHRDKTRLLRPFLDAEISRMGSSLQYFLREVVSKSSIVSNNSDRQTVQWGCKVASNALSKLSNNFGS